MSKLIWITALVLVAGRALAGVQVPPGQGPVTQVPEMDLNSPMTGLTLLLGGLAVWRGRSRK